MDNFFYQSDQLETILVVDDSVENLQVLTALLRDKYKVKVAKSGAKAIEILESDSSVDLILLDIMMPEMDGPTTLACLRKMTQMLHTPAIFITAKVQPSEVEYLKSLGAIGVLAKPFDPMQLASQVRELWEKSIAP